MTTGEYQAKLERLSDGEMEKFECAFLHRARAVNAGNRVAFIDARVEEFAIDPKREHHICSLLGLKTEAQKNTDATVGAAGAAKWSAACSVIACLVAVAATAVAIAIAAYLKP